MNCELYIKYQVDIERKGGRYGNCVDTTVSNSDLNVYEEINDWTKYSQMVTKDIEIMKCRHKYLLI